MSIQGRHDDAKNATSIFRMTRSSGFDGRVMPIWHDLRVFRRKMGLLERLREKSRLRRLVQAINAALAARGSDSLQWDREDGDCVCHLHVERVGLLEDLRRFAHEGLPSGKARHLPHLLSGRDKHALYLPADFPTPFLVHDGTQDIPVGSAPNLLAELATLDKFLHVESELTLPAEANRVVASQEVVQKFDSKAMYDPLFWAKFGYLVLKKLATSAVEHRLPAILS